VFKISSNLLSLNGSVVHFLDKAYAKIRYAITDREIRSREIIDMFANQREDRKRVENALREGKLLSSLDDRLAVDQLTEEQFFSFYRFLTQRIEVNRIFESM
jgi:phosphatidylinositol phospholipase C beta